MNLGFNVGYSGSRMKLNIDLIQEAEKLGFDSVWTAEAYGSDAISPLAWIGALTSRIKLGTSIMQIPGRTPAMTAMTAMTMDHLSDGRFLLGLGPSGPQVVEGWHGVAYGKPLTRTREYIKIIRDILAREAPLEFKGSHYEVPFKGEGATGLGKPLKSILHGRSDLPIYTASISPNGLRCAGEVSDGVMLVWASPERFNLVKSSIEEGFVKSETKKSWDQFDVVSNVVAIMGDDLDQCRMPVKAMLSLYIGGMGARGKNFYNDFAKRMGYEEDATKIQDLYLAGKKNEALAAVPDQLVDEIALLGPAERIRDRFAAWKDSGVNTMLVGGGQPEVLRLLAELAA